MTGKTFFILTLSGFFAMLVGLQIDSRPMALFSMALMCLPAAAVIIQSEVK